MKDTKQIIRELVEEVLEEMTATGAVAGYMTPAAFRGHKSKKKTAEKSMPGGKVVGKEDTDDTTIGESENESLPTVRRDVNIMEAKVDMKGKTCEKCKKGKYTETGVQDDMHGVLHCEKCGHETKRHKEKINEARSRYRNFKESDMMRNHAKVSYGINQAKKMLGEVEYLVSICERLKTECGYSNDNLWARTKPDMVEIHRRLKEIAKRINRMGK
jgi:Zn ribbon nucleic-acid-binding protein